MLSKSQLLLGVTQVVEAFAVLFHRRVLDLLVYVCGVRVDSDDLLVPLRIHVFAADFDFLQVF